MNGRNQYKLIGLALAAAALLASGCGGGGSSTTVTKAEFVKQGNEICKAGVAKKDAELEAGLRKQAREGGELDQKGKEQFVVEVAVPPIRSMIEELDELDLPAEGTAQAEALIAEMDRILEEVEEDPNKVLGTTDPFTKANAQAAKFGLKECARL